MPRKSSVIKKHDIELDAKYQSILVSKLVNSIMQDGKKSVAQSIVYGALDFLKEETGEDALTVYEAALENVKPPIEVRSRRVGGATYQVPVDVNENRQLALALRWIVGFSKKRKDHSMEKKLGKELLDAYNKAGASMKKKADTIKMAEANRAFAHYKW